MELSRDNGYLTLIASHQLQEFKKFMFEFNLIMLLTTNTLNIQGEGILPPPHPFF